MMLVLTKKPSKILWAVSVPFWRRFSRGFQEGRTVGHSSQQEHYANYRVMSRLSFPATEPPDPRRV